MPLCRYAQSRQHVRRIFVHRTVRNRPSSLDPLPQLRDFVAIQEPQPCLALAAHMAVLGIRARRREDVKSILWRRLASRFEQCNSFRNKR